MKVKWTTITEDKSTWPKSHSFMVNNHVETTQFIDLGNGIFKCLSYGTLWTISSLRGWMWSTMTESSKKEILGMSDVFKKQVISDMERLDELELIKEENIDDKILNKLQSLSDQNSNNHSDLINKLLIIIEKLGYKDHLVKRAEYFHQEFDSNIKNILCVLGRFSNKLDNGTLWRSCLSDPPKNNGFVITRRINQPEFFEPKDGGHRYESKYFYASCHYHSKDGWNCHHNNFSCEKDSLCEWTNLPSDEFMEKISGVSSLARGPISPWKSTKIKPPEMCIVVARSKVGSEYKYNIICVGKSYEKCTLIQTLFCDVSLFDRYYDEWMEIPK